MFDPVLNPVSYTLFKSLPLIIMAVLIFNMVQRLLYRCWGKKRTASFYLAIVLIVFISVAALIMRFRLTDLLLIPAGLGLVIFIILKKEAFFPFTLKCLVCSAPLSIKRIVGNDSNLCEECEQKEKPELE